MDIKKGIGFFVPLLRNKYSLAFIAVLVWVVFLDSNNFIDRVANMRHIHRLEKDIIFYKEKIAEDRAKLEELQTNPANLEKFAREQYLMKKDNEDIFIIEN